MKKRMKQNDLLRQIFFDDWQPEEEMEQGQLLVILAASMIALLVAAGLAIDGGFLFVRRAQLARAIDSAALSGVVVLYDNRDVADGDGNGLTDGIAQANARAEQVFALNGVPIEQQAGDDGNPDDTQCWAVGDTNWDTFDMCGTQNPGSVPGAVRYLVSVQWENPVFFMSILGFEDIPLYASAEAEYYPVVDIYASGTTTTGVVRTAIQNIIGPEFRPSLGDAYTAWPKTTGQTTEDWREIEGIYTYRIEIPQSYVQRYISSPEGPLVRVELMDPDNYNCSGNCATRAYQRNGAATNYGAGGDVGVIEATGESTDPAANQNPYWFIKVDQGRSFEGVNERTPLMFRLYYFRERSDGSLEQVDVAYYRSSTNTGETDMMWVSPTADANQTMKNPVLMLEQDFGYTTWLNDDGGAYTTEDYYELEPGLLCTDDPRGDGSGDTIPDTKCFYADTDGDGNLTRDAAEDREPTLTLANCATTATQQVWPDNTTDAEVFAKTFYPDVSEIPSDNCTQGTNNGDFIVNVSGENDSETPGIFVDPATSVRYLYMDVMGLDGTSENGYELFAGPPASVQPAPPNINSRNMWSTNIIEYAGINPTIGDPRDSQGIQIFALGYIPMNALDAFRAETPLSFVSGVFEGADITVEVYDQDGGAQGPMYLYFENLPKEDFLMCWGANQNECENTASSHYGLTDFSGIDYRGGDGIPNGGDWNVFTFTIPNDEVDGFLGGRMFMSYQNGGVDSFTIKITVDSRPYLTQ